MTWRLFSLWFLSLVLALVLAQAFFTGEQTSEVVGNLALALLALGLPLSVLAYPLALAVISYFEIQGLFPYNSRFVLSVWWGVFFGCGLAQWALIFWLINHYKPKIVVKRDVRVHP